MYTSHIKYNIHIPSKFYLLETISLTCIVYIPNNKLITHPKLAKAVCSYPSFLIMNLSDDVIFGIMTSGIYTYMYTFPNSSHVTIVLV